MSKDASSKTTSLAGESTGKAKYMFLPDTSGVEATEEPHTHPSKVFQKQTDQTKPWRRDLHSDVLFEAARKNAGTHREERETCKAMSVTLLCNFGVPQCQCSSQWRTTFHPQDSDNADRAPQNGTDSQDAHTCNRGGPCQNRGGSL